MRSSVTGTPSNVDLRKDCPQQRGGSCQQAGRKARQQQATYSYSEIVALQQVAAWKSSRVGRDLRQQWLPAGLALSSWHRHGAERRPRSVWKAKAAHAELGDASVRDGSHLEVRAVVSKCEVGVLKLRVDVSHEAGAYDRVFDVLAVAQQPLALLVPRLGHGAQAVDEDGQWLEGCLALAGYPNDALASAARPRRLDDVAHALVVDLLGVARLLRVVHPRKYVGELRPADCTEHCEAR
mmetsp:Transcript_69707/g.204017  ORF Transcript_69707/g.204017 Transcript_69707/m.204017 type:complete len:238 (-) Transcript_69707:407-1120(-)